MKAGKLIVAATFAVVCGAASGAAGAQGYWTGSGQSVWKNGAGQCWRAGTWTPAMATTECDPDLAPKPAARPTPPPAARPAPKPAAKSAAKPAAKPRPVVLRSTVSFASNKSALDDADKAQLEADIIRRLSLLAAINYVGVKGHTDRMGSAQYNQKLSERRAAAVKAHLVARGMEASQIEVHGHGKAVPVTDCPESRERKALAACLAPNRRVEVELQGTPR